MKKICYVTTIAGTLQTFVLPLLEYQLKHTDWELTVICDDTPEVREWLPEKVRYIPVSMKRGISLGGIGAMLKITKIFRAEKFDLVQYSTPNASVYASVAAKLAGIPVRLYCQWGMVFVGFRGLKRRIFKSIEKMVCRLSTWVEPDSFGNLEFGRQEGFYTEKKSSVIWNGSASGVNLKKFDISQKQLWNKTIREQLGIEKDAFVYGFIGRITGDKGINELFTAYRRLVKDEKQTYLIILGRVDRPETLDEELWQWAKNEPSVLFCGYTDVVERYIAAMNVYILPSYREGFGSAVIEAEAMGVPVIVSDIPGPTDAMLKNETGLIVKKADPDSLYSAMLQIKNDPQSSERFSAAAQQFVVDRFEQTKLFSYILKDRERLMNIHREEPNGKENFDTDGHL